MASALTLRTKASLIHLAVCTLIAVAALFMVFGLWYPSPLHKAVGVTHVFLMMLLIDVVLGPVLTFIVYRKGKRTLPLDLAVIVILQLSAFSYGMWSMAQGRPVWIAFGVDRFDLIRAVDIDSQNQEGASAEFIRPSLFGPRWALALPPSDAAARTKMLFDALQGRSDLAQRPNLYHRLESAPDVIRAQAHSLDELARFNSTESVSSVLARWPAADGWLPMMANALPMVVLISKERANVIAVVDLRPW